MRILLALALVTTLAACGTPQPPRQWFKAGGDPLDQKACAFEAEKGAVSSDPNGFIAEYEKAQKRQKLMQLCMESKGWTR